MALGQQQAENGEPGGQDDRPGEHAAGPLPRRLALGQVAHRLRSLIEIARTARGEGHSGLLSGLEDPESREQRAASYVRPLNKAIPFDLYVAPHDRGKARQGDKVVAEITAYHTDKRPPTGKVLKVIEKPEDPKTEAEAIIEELNLPRKFPKAVHDEAKLLSAGRRDEGMAKRKNLRSLKTVTIDGERAKDFDDAVSIGLTEHGFRLWVHIADVGFYVPWGSEIDGEARKRGTSIYFPDRVLPMLPKELSEELCSLKPEVERFAFTVEMDFDRDGERGHEKFYPSVIRSDARMTYTSVRKILVDHDDEERRKYDHLLADLELMNELCGILRFPFAT